MGLEDFIKSDPASDGQLTREALNKGMRDALYFGLTPTQRLELDERLYGTSYIHAMTGERIPPWEVSR